VLGVFKKIKILNKSNLFDAEYYNTQAGISCSKINSIKHYLKNGIISPNRLFSNEYYLSSNDDVASAGVSPFLHFVAYGAQEKRLCNERLDLPYVDDYIKGTNQEGKNYLTVIIEDAVKFCDVDEESFFIDYDQKIRFIPELCG